MEGKDMITSQVNGETLVFSFSEQMNTDNSIKCQEEIYKRVQGLKKPVIFDMEKVDYIASIFLSICIHVSKEIGAENLTLQNVHPNVKKVFKIAKLDSLIKIV